MFGNRTARTWSEPGDHVDDTVGQTGFPNQLAEPECGQRRLLRGFEYHGVAASEGRSHLLRGHHQRKIPRRYQAAYTDGLAQCVVEGRRIRRVGFAVDFGGPPRKVAEDSRRSRDIDRTRLRKWLAVVEGFELCQFIRMLVD